MMTTMRARVMGVALLATSALSCGPGPDEGVIRLNPIGLYLRDFEWTAQL